MSPLLASFPGAVLGLGTRLVLCVNCEVLSLLVTDAVWGTSKLMFAEMFAVG